MSLLSHCLKHGKLSLLRQWDTDKNKPFTPESIASTSTTRVWWKCEKGHSWQTQLSSRVRGSSGCPICLRQKIDMRMEKQRAALAERKYHRKSNYGGKEE